MERLRDELNSDDAVSVMEHLDAPIAQRLYAAMSGWGVDVGEVVRICSNATKAEKLEAARREARVIEAGRAAAEAAWIAHKLWQRSCSPSRRPTHTRSWPKSRKTAKITLSQRMNGT